MSCAHPASASVTITLDTKAPVVTVLGPSRAEPPEVIEYLITASEPMGVTAYVVVDAEGVAHSLGAVRVDDFTDRLLVPTTGLPTGPTRLQVLVTDTVGNATTQGYPLLVVRPRLLEATGAASPVFLLTTSRGVSMELTTGVEGSAELRPLQDESFEVATAATQAFEVEADADGDE